MRAPDAWGPVRSAETGNLLTGPLPGCFCLTAAGQGSIGIAEGIWAARRAVSTPVKQMAFPPLAQSSCPDVTGFGGRQRRLAGHNPSGIPPCREMLIQDICALRGGNLTACRRTTARRPPMLDGIGHAGPSVPLAARDRANDHAVSQVAFQPFGEDSVRPGVQNAEGLHDKR